MIQISDKEAVNFITDLNLHSVLFKKENPKIEFRNKNNEIIVLCQKFNHNFVYFKI
jgi:hypothetical protein